MNTVRPRESWIEWASVREAYQAQIRVMDAELVKNRAAAKALFDEQKAACNADENIVNKKSYDVFTVASDLAQQARAAEFDTKKRLCTPEARSIEASTRARAAVVSTVLEVRYSLETWRAREGERPAALADGNPDPKGGASTEHSRR
jgi:hypothetical protein